MQRLAAAFSRPVGTHRAGLYQHVLSAARVARRDDDGALCPGFAAAWRWRCWKLPGSSPADRRIDGLKIMVWYAATLPRRSNGGTAPAGRGSPPEVTDFGFPDERSQCRRDLCRLTVLASSWQRTKPHGMSLRGVSLKNWSERKGRKCLARAARPARAAESAFGNAFATRHPVRHDPPSVRYWRRGEWHRFHLPADGPAAIRRRL